MQLSHSPRSVSATFDDQTLVSMSLASDMGHRWLGCSLRWLYANSDLNVTSLLAGVLADA